MCVCVILSDYCEYRSSNECFPYMLYLRYRHFILAFYYIFHRIFFFFFLFSSFFFVSFDMEVWFCFILARSKTREIIAFAVRATATNRCLARFSAFFLFCFISFFFLYFVLHILRHRDREKAERKLLVKCAAPAAAVAVTRVYERGTHFAFHRIYLLQFNAQSTFDPYRIFIFSLLLFISSCLGFLIIIFIDVLNI